MKSNREKRRERKEMSKRVIKKKTRTDEEDEKKKEIKETTKYICQSIIPKNNIQHQSSERTCEIAQSE
jgi:hypothetical protein